MSGARRARPRHQDAQVRWHAHEGRQTVVSIMSSNGVVIQEISDTVGVLVLGLVLVCWTSQ
jgi:hypothetical protein